MLMQLMDEQLLIYGLGIYVDASDNYYLDQKRGFKENVRTTLDGRGTWKRDRRHRFSIHEVLQDLDPEVVAKIEAGLGPAKLCHPCLLVQDPHLVWCCVLKTKASNESRESRKHFDVRPVRGDGEIEPLEPSGRIKCEQLISAPRDEIRLDEGQGNLRK